MIVRHLNLRAQAIRTIRQSRNIRCSWAVRGGPLVCEASTRRVSPRARQGRGRTPSVRQEPTPQGHRLHVGSVFPRGFPSCTYGFRAFIHPSVPARQDFLVARVSRSRSPSAQAASTWNRPEPRNAGLRPREGRSPPRIAETVGTFAFLRSTYAAATRSKCRCQQEADPEPPSMTVQPKFPSRR